MKKITFTALILSALLFLSSCGNETEPTTTDEQLDEQATVSETQDTSLFENAEKFKSESLFTPAKNQKQYKVDDENAEMLASAIEKYLWNDKHIIEDFSDIKEVSDVSAFMFAAFASDKVPEIVNLSSVTAEDPENPISVLYAQCAEGGSAPASIYYLDEWQDVIRSLFGDENPALFEFEDGEMKSNYGGSEASLTIYTEYNAAVSYGTAVFVRGLPQITFYEENDEGYICEAVILHPDGILTMSDGSTVTVTEENFDEYSSYHSKYRYTFTKTDDGLVLSSLETLENEFVQDNNAEAAAAELIENVNSMQSVMKWFVYGCDVIGVDQNETYYLEDGTYYYKINDPVFSENGINSINSMKEYLGAYFTAEYVDNLLEQYDSLFIEANSDLYVVAASAGMSGYFDSPVFNMEYLSDNEIKLSCNVEYHLFDAEHEANTLVFEFVKQDGKWLISSTPNIHDYVRIIL